LFTIFTIIEQIINWALALVSKFGYGGIFFTMMLESAAIPIPSEVVLPFSGFLASSGRFSFWLIVFVAAAANLTGATIIYFIGFFGGRTILERYGKYLLISTESISKMDRWLDRYEAQVAFFSRLLPGVRTFSSLLIGAGKINFKKFIFYTLAGSFIWNLPLAYVGLITGNNWNFLRPYFQKFELAILAAFLIIVIWFIFKKIYPVIIKKR
jgi:membrane protein DedA with SNARE-associated domain